jgi:Patatin-like phospholipase
LPDFQVSSRPLNGPAMDQYADSDFADPAADCDLIMKGGITSGVVYPLAIVELAKHFRLAHVGGTSAGAIGAAAAAAAEYGRHKPGRGFIRLAEVPGELGKNLFSLFQPSPALKPVFDIAVACIGNAGFKTAKVILAALSGFRYDALAGALFGVIVAAAGWYGSDWAVVLLGLLLTLIGMIVAVGLAAYRTVSQGIPDNDFGLCPGKSQPGYSTPGLTDWLADLIDDIAGRDPATDQPLTFGDLEPSGPTDGDGKKITLRMMTTNLTMKRPYSLPFDTGIYAFRLSDFEKLFPERITSYLAGHCEKAEEPGEFDDLFMFPTGGLPVVVAARMSLSFPLLICAVPLYARDYTLRPEEAKKWRKNVFSDGGISSNFPIHFFDRMLPNSPTFAISLDDFDAKRQPAKLDKLDPNDPLARVWLPDTKHAGSGVLIPSLPFGGVVGLLSRIVDAAKDWQDSLQSTLAGYRDRIVHVNLKPEEGGLNISMPAGLVVMLSKYGAQAGIDLRDQFDLKEHRWRRFLVTMDDLGETLIDFAKAYDGTGGIESFKDFLDQYPAHAIAYKDAANPPDIAVLRQRAAALADLGRDWAAQSPIPDGHMPHPKTKIRISPLP